MFELLNESPPLTTRMFKTDLSMPETVKKLSKEEGWAFGVRGMGSNMTAVAIPIAVTIFMTDVLTSLKYGKFS